MLSDWFEKLNKRERWLALGVLAIAVWVVFDTMAWQPSQKKIKKYNIENAALAAEIRELTAVTAATDKALKNDPNLIYKTRIGELRENIQALQTSLESTAGQRMSTSRDTPSAVQFLLRSQPALHLQQLKKNAPEAVIDNAAALTGTGTQSPEAGELALKKHPVDIELRGRYEDIAGFIENLAVAHPDVAFESFHLQSKEYPINELRLRLAIFSYDGTLAP